MNDPKKLAEQKAEHKRMKRLRARFNGHLPSNQPGFSMQDKENSKHFKDKVQQWLAAW